MEKLPLSGTQVQTTATYSLWQKGRVEQRIATIKEVAGRSAMSVVSNAHALNQREGSLGIVPSYTSFRPANEGRRRTDGWNTERSFSIRRWWTGY